MPFSLSGLDWAIVALVMFNLWRGWRQGLFRTAVSLVGWVLALLIGLKLAPVAAPLLGKWLPLGTMSQIGGFVVVVLVVLLMLWAVAALMAAVFRRLHLGWLEKLGGGLLGAIKSLFMILILINALAPWLHRMELWQQSRLIHQLLPFAPLAGRFAHDAMDEVRQHMNGTNADQADAGVRPEPAHDDPQGSRARTVDNPF